MVSKKIVLDMFAGAGGLTEGFFRNDFNIVSHIEMNVHAARTLETRTLFHALVEKGQQDIYYQYYDQEISRDEFLEECKSLDVSDTGIIDRELSVETLDKTIADVHARLDDLNRNNVDVIIGGPPCQAYSLIGRARDLNKMRNDPRNHLYIHYLRFIDEFKPEIFVFENVPGLISARNGEIYSDFLERIKSLGYYTPPEPKILNARDFGVLQNRKRIIFIGWKKDHDLTYPGFEIAEPRYKIWDVLKDLRELEPGEGTDGPQRYRVGRPSGYLKRSHIRNNHRYVRHHIARNHNDRDREIYRTAIRMWNDSKKRLRYNELPENLKTHANQSSFLDRFKVVDGDGLSHAIVAHLSKDGHFFIHPDISQARSLTVREAARIQSFPDNYLFEGPRTAQYVQIGNAVPPLMAEGIAREIKKMIQKVVD
ncbi:DNA cytosine methyltransferase [Methanofollis aquaemaris]|uniref:DNA (cytosine-5-)-methyltransferase n=1 Tax=Methanofollis aquaemaris TaxID=126734 RepID=A0A8A3S5N3_9EURY|nr:DNA cytosine methyltransferase [Methanofollis aquaemaris]QSZ66934.1 DNA cytosine methyltransferase [Methanofollis aquaemaris]